MKLGLNVGSGQRPFTSTPEVEWVNIDKIAREGFTPDRVCDGAHLPYADGTVDYFVLHHVLEHFGCGGGTDLINEAWRVLAPGGSLLVFVPDVRALCTRWLRGELDTQIFFTNLYGAYMGHEEDRHKWGFDPKSLDNFLGQWEWSEMQFCSARPPGSNIAEDWWILAMRCLK